MGGVRGRWGRRGRADDNVLLQLFVVTPMAMEGDFYTFIVFMGKFIQVFAYSFMVLINKLA